MQERINKILLCWYFKSSLIIIFVFLRFHIITIRVVYYHDSLIGEKLKNCSTSLASCFFFSCLLSFFLVKFYLPISYFLSTFSYSFFLSTQLDDSSKDEIVTKIEIISYWLLMGLRFIVFNEDQFSIWFYL